MYSFPNSIYSSMNRGNIIDIYVKCKEKSDDDYEKLIGYVAAGTIVLSMSFIEKIVPLKGANCLWILILAWIALAATLVLNLISHQKSSKVHQSCINDLQDESIEDDKVFDLMALKNRPIDHFNTACSVSLGLGVLALILFCSINIYTMQDKNDINNGTTGNDYFEKGRTVTELRPSSGTSEDASSSIPAEAQPAQSEPKPSSNNQ
jgi:hypothetical protein